MTKRWSQLCLVAATLALILAAVTAAEAQAPKAAKIDLNTATQEELEKLPGVGEATAKKIVAGRPYKSTADLAKAGVPKNTIEKITPLVTASGAAGTKAADTARAMGKDADAAVKDTAKKTTDTAKARCLMMPSRSRLTPSRASAPARGRNVTTETNGKSFTSRVRLAAPPGTADHFQKAR